MRYLDPKNDLTFKRIFGEHPHLLLSFLNGVMPFESDDQYIVSLTYLPSELVPVAPELKNSIVDVRCVDNFGRHFIIEIQLIFSDSFYSRVLFNASKIYSRQLIKKRAYIDLTPVYSINIINDSMHFEDDSFYHHYTISNKNHPERKLNGMEFLFIELPKFKVVNFSQKKLLRLWLIFLSAIENKTEMIPEELMEVPEIAEAVQLLKESSYTQAQLEQYDKYWDAIITQKSMIKDAELKGAYSNALETANNLKQMKVMSNVDIAKATGLPLDEVEKL